MNQLAIQRMRLGRHMGPLSAYRPKKERSKKEYVLRSLPGIGTQMAKSLLDKFGSISNVINAPEEEILKVHGLGPKEGSGNTKCHQRCRLICISKTEKVYQILRGNKIKYEANCRTMNDPSIELSRHLFWDIPHKSLNYERDKVFIAKRVVELGTINDWNILRQRFGIDVIAKILMPIKDLDKKSASFVSILSGIPTNQFTCFSTKQSRPKHWIS